MLVQKFLVNLLKSLVEKGGTGRKKLKLQMHGGTEKYGVVKATFSHSLVLSNSAINSSFV